MRNYVVKVLTLFSKCVSTILLVRLRLKEITTNLVIYGTTPPYKNGKKEGVEKWYYRSGELIWEALYKNGQPISGYKYSKDGIKRPLTNAHLHILNTKGYLPLS